jgi:hypothetical protein
MWPYLTLDNVSRFPLHPKGTVNDAEVADDISFTMADVASKSPNTPIRSVQPFMLPPHPSRPRARRAHIQCAGAVQCRNGASIQRLMLPRPERCCYQPQP